MNVLPIMRLFFIYLTVAHDNFINKHFIPEQEVLQAQYR